MKVVRGVVISTVGLCIALGGFAPPASAVGDGRLAFAYFYLEKWLEGSDMARDAVCGQYKTNSPRVVNDFTNAYQRMFNMKYGPNLKPPVAVSLAQARLTIIRSLSYDCSTEGRKHWHDLPPSKSM